jgi:hypothetical protein
VTEVQESDPLSPWQHTVLSSIEHELVPHATVGFTQLPLPSQKRALDVSSSQGVCAGKDAYTQLRSSLHCPNPAQRLVVIIEAPCWHCDGLLQVTGWQAGSSAGTTSQRPVPGRHAMHGPLQLLSQHTPSTHCPLAHCEELVQLAPRPLLETEQLPVPSHNVVALQLTPALRDVKLQSWSGLPQLPLMQRLEVMAAG